jgi:hypothetical protein
MSTEESRKETIRRYKEQKPDVGIYAVRCTVTGRVWVGATNNLQATQNRCWFTLRNGLSVDSSLQEEWNLHGEPALRCEILDCFKKDLHPLEVDELLKKNKNDWAAKFGAQPLR